MATTTLSWFEHLSILSIPFLIKICVAAAILIAARFLIKLVSPRIQAMCQQHHFDHHTSHLLEKIVQYTIMAFATACALQNIGIEMSMIITAFGITGIVVSYGMKDIVANFIASVLILGYKHIKIDDRIMIAASKEWQGTIVDINLRYTTLKNEEMTIFVPNILLYTQTVALLNSKSNKSGENKSDNQ